MAELFEARRPKDCAVIAEMDGRVEFGRDYKNKRRIKITPEDGGEAVEFLIPKGKHIAVHDGDVIRKGEYLIDGNPDPHDILRIQGIEALADFLVNEIQEVYRLQGVPINDKHIETIVRQMLQKVEILEPGDTGLLKGDHLDKPEVDEENAKAEARGGRPALTQPVLLGITKAVAADPLLHLGGLVPGDHPRAHRRLGAGQDRHPGRAEGERDRRPPDPGRHRLLPAQPAAHRRQARRGADGQPRRGHGAAAGESSPTPPRPSRSSPKTLQSKRNRAAREQSRAVLFSGPPTSGRARLPWRPG